MPGFLDDFLQQVSQSVAASTANPATLPVNPTQQFPIASTPEDLYRVNQSLAQMTQQATQPRVLAGLGNAAQSPAAQLASQIAPAAVAPKMAPSLTAPNPAMYAGAGPSAGPVAAAVPSAVSSVASVADDAVLSSVDDVAATTLGSRMRSAFPALSGANIGKGSIMKGGAAAVAGLVASGWLDSQDFGGENSNMDQALKGGAIGAGLGAGIALALGGPVGWAALGGAALFGIGNAVLGDNDTAEEKMDKKITMANETINELINNPAFGIDQDTATQIRLQVAATTEFYKNAKDQAGLESYLAGLAQTVPSFLMEASQRNQTQQMKMQMQAQFGPVYSRMVDRSSTAAKQAFDIQLEAANAISDPATAGAMKSQAAQQYTAQMDTLAAYAQQVAQSPSQLKPSEQVVVDQTQTMMQQFMGA